MRFFNIYTIPLAAVLCISLLFSCTTHIEFLEPPPGYSSSSSEQTWNYCVFATMCLDGPVSSCPDGGQLSNNCPIAAPSSSSGGVHYAYCIFDIEGTCFAGSFTICPGEGRLSNTCPYEPTIPSSSSNSLTSSGSGTRSSSSAGSSEQCGGFEGDEFVDPRDCNRYKYKVASNGRVWMMENLNYSRNNTLGWCYKTGTDANKLGTPGEDLPGCDKPYGRHYTYAIAMDGTQEQGLCPEGWNIPSIAEWGAVSGMPSSFYVKAGNYDATKGWKERGDYGFYWARNPPSGTSVGFAFVSNTSIDARSPGDPYAAKTSDYFSVRCIMDMDMDADFKLTCGDEPFDPRTQQCSGVKLSYDSNGPQNTPCGGKTIYIKLPADWGSSTYITWVGQFILITGTKEGEWTKFTLPTNLQFDSSIEQEIIFSDYDGYYNNHGVIHYITRNAIGDGQQLPNGTADKFKCSDFGEVTYITEAIVNIH